MSGNKEWLVKSSGEIKGPFSFDEVVEQIKTKEIILVDEVARSFGRWSYVRDEGVFESAVLELRNKEDSRSEKTYTSSSTDAITQEITDGVISFSKTQKIQASVEEFMNQQNEKRKQKAQTPDSTTSYAYEKDVQVQSSLNQRHGIQMLGFVLILVTIFFGYRLYRGDRQLSREEQKSLATTQFIQGQFVDAKKNFEELLASNSQDVDLKYQYALNSLYLGDHLISEKYLEELKSLNTKYGHQVYNLLGIIQLKNYNLSEAREYFENAIKIDSGFLAAHYNKGIVDFLENKFLMAHESFKKALDLGGQDGVILLMNTEFLLNNAHLVLPTETIVAETAILKKQIEDHIRKYFIYRQELLIALAALESAGGEGDPSAIARIEDLLRKAVQEEPDLTQDHIFDMSFYRDVVTWNRIHGWIKQMKLSLLNNEDLSTLFGLSLFKGTEKIEGKSYIEGRLEPYFSHPIDHILNVYILSNLGRYSEAEVALMSIPEDKWNFMAYNLKAKICYKKQDYDCAKNNYQKALLQNKDNPVSLVGLASSFRDLGDIASAKSYLSLLEKSSSFYKPYLDLKYKLEYGHD